MTWSRRNALLGSLAALSLAGAIPAWADDLLAKIKEAKKIRVAMDLGAPPFGMMDEKLQPTGSEVETARLLASDLGVELDIVPVTSANRVPFLQTNKADVVVCVFGITPERQQVVDFSLPYAAVASVVAGPVGDNTKSFADLAGKRIAVTRGTTNDQELTKGAPPTAEIVRFDDDATSVTALVSGQLDYFATAPALIGTVQKQRTKNPIDVKFVMRNFPYAVGLRKGNDTLRTYLDGWVRTNVHNGKLAAIFKKYHNLPLPEEVIAATK